MMKRRGSPSNSAVRIARQRRRQSRIVILVASSCSVFFLTVIQLRAQFLASESLGRAAVMMNNGPAARNKTRRMLLSTSEAASAERSSYTGATTATSSSNRIQYLAFGSASTYGVGLSRGTTSSSSSSSEGSADGSTYQHESYAYQVAQYLQADLVNAANRIDGSSLAAACTQTIVGNDVNFDVISVEYSVFDQNVQVLASRLRKRFPLAKIVLIELWNPLMLRYNNTTTSEGETTILDFNQWKEHERTVDNSFDTHLASMDLALRISRAGPRYWSLTPPSNATQQLLKDTVESTGASVISLPKPTDRVWTDAAAVRDYLSWFQDDNPKVLSVSGQAALAQVVRMSVAEMIAATAPTQQPGALGSWGSGDSCNLWFSSGNFGSVVGASRSVDFAHADDNNHKHAIEFRRLRGDSVKVSNPFSTARMLYLTYMTAVEDGVYPRTKVRINGVPTVQIDPFHDFDDQPTEQEFARTTAVGMIPPLSTASIRLDPLQRSALHFRLVGASLIADEMHHVPIEFSLEAESVKKQDTRSSLLSWSFW